MDLADQNRLLDEILSETLIFFNQHSVFDLLHYIAQKMLDKFVPMYLAFVVQEEFSPDEARILCFQNLKSVDNLITISSLTPYRTYFSQMPASITFDAFKYMINDEKLTDVFLPLLPEIIVPMMGLDGMYGFIVFGQKANGSPYTHHEISYIDRIMKYASASLQNHIHYTRAIMESKTRLYNHAFFIRKMDEELARVRRYHTYFSVIMMDIDHFKPINNKYGHLTGDKILAELAAVLRKNTRESDVAARFGGEKIIILLYQTEIDQAFIVAEKIRCLIEKTDFISSDHPIKVTISLGVSFVSKEKYSDTAGLLTQVDEALYHAKKNGRIDWSCSLPDWTNSLKIHESTADMRG